MNLIFTKIQSDIGGIIMQNLVVEKDNDIYDIYILFDTKYCYVRPLYKGTDIEKAREAINRYCESHIKKIECLRKGSLKKLERLNKEN